MIRVRRISRLRTSRPNSIAAGKTFAGYSESMPRGGYRGCYHGLYDRNHNPWVEFTNVPESDNLVYKGFPSTVASFVWITPNLCHDTHNCPVRVGDKWLSRNLPPIIAWDFKHDGLLIVTWDEADPDDGGENHIPNRAGRADDPSWRSRYAERRSLLRVAHD